MESIKLTDAELARLESMFDKILTDYPSNSMINKYIHVFKNYLSEYKANGTFVRKDIVQEITFVINYLKVISKETSLVMATAAKESCKSCIFHVDHCMINVFFVVFKSIELKKFIDFKDLRPSMRMIF